MILKKVLYYVHKYNKNAWYITPFREDIFVIYAVSFWIFILTTIICFAVCLFIKNIHPSILCVPPFVSFGCFTVMDVLCSIAKKKHKIFDDIDKAYDMEFEKSFRIKAQLFVGIPWLLTMIMGIAGLVFLICIMIKANHH